MTGRKRIKIGRLVLSTVRQPRSAPLLDSCVTVEREDERVFVGGRWHVIGTSELWRARGWALRLFTPPFESQPIALTVAWIGAPMPPSGPMIRAALRGRWRSWPLKPAGLGRVDGGTDVSGS